MYEGVPPDRREQFEQFMVAYANSGAIMDAVIAWVGEMPLHEDLDEREIVAPPYEWLSKHTGLTDGMLATGLLGLFATGGIVPHPERDDVWVLSGEGEMDPEAGRERMFRVLDLITTSGHHIDFQALPTHQADEIPPPAPTHPARHWRKLLRRRRPS